MLAQTAQFDNQEVTLCNWTMVRARDKAGVITLHLVGTNDAGCAHCSGDIVKLHRSDFGSLAESASPATTYNLVGPEQDAPSASAKAILAVYLHTLNLTLLSE